MRTLLKLARFFKSASESELVSCLFASWALFFPLTLYIPSKVLPSFFLSFLRSLRFSGTWNNFTNAKSSWCQLKHSTTYTMYPQHEHENKIVNDLILTYDEIHGESAMVLIRFPTRTFLSCIINSNFEDMHLPRCFRFLWMTRIEKLGFLGTKFG